MNIKVYFDPVTCGFYQSNIHTSIPTTAIEVSHDQRKQLLEGESNGKQITVKQGSVILVDKILTVKDLILVERHWRDSELKRADVELNKVQDSDPKAIGTVAAWREYRKALRAWPEHKDFPNKEFRPKSPDAN